MAQLGDDLPLDLLRVRGDDQEFIGGLGAFDDRVADLKTRFAALIEHYQELFRNEGSVPFCFVAIPRTGGTATDENNTDIEAVYNTALSYIRLAQTEVYTEFVKAGKNVGIVPTLDIYGNKEYTGKDNGNNRVTFHPGQKPLIAQRLVNWALSELYGRTDVAVNGPEYRSCVSKNGRLILTYECEGELSLLPPDAYSDSLGDENRVTYGIDETKPQEFEIAGDDGVYHGADAELIGNTVVLSSPEVDEPVSFRYAMSGYGTDTYVECPNLTDDSGLPALVTQGTAAASETGNKKAKLELSEDGRSVIITAEEASETAVLIKTVYNREGVLESIKIIEEVSELRSGKNTVHVGDTVSENGGKVKLMLFNSLSDIIPLSEVCTE